MKKLLVTREAEVDLLDNYFYLNEIIGERARQNIREITDKFDILCENPFAGRQRNDLGLDYRLFPVGSYNIIYKVSDARVTVLRVLHGSRDLTGLFTQGN